MGATLGPGFVGRDAEVARAQQIVVDGATGPVALVVSGIAGIGKTALWRTIIEDARGRGYHVLTARPSEEEMLGALVGLVDLVERADIDGSVLEPELDPFSRGRRLLEALRRLAADAPVLIAIDDLQWLDFDSARTLSYAFRRLEDERVLLAATWRTGSTDDVPVSPLSFPHARVTRLDLAPLTRSELRDLLVGRWGRISPLTQRTIARVSGGNPLYAIELAQALTEEELAVGIAGNVRLPDSLSGAIEQRLGIVGPELQSVLELIAVAGPATIGALESQLPGVDLGAELAAGRDLGLITRDEQLRIRFAHPLLASAVESHINPVAARDLHRRLSEHAADPVVRAQHLALSTEAPDAAIAAELEDAGRAVRSRGALGMAARFARHSARLTPPDDADAITRRTLLEASVLAAAGEISRARIIVDRLVNDLPPGPARAEVLLARFYVENDDVDVADATLEQAFGEAVGDPLLAGRVLDLLGWHRGVFRGDLRAGILAAEQAVAVLAATNDHGLQAWARGHLAHMEAFAGKPQPELMKELAATFEAEGKPDLGGGPAAWRAKQLIWAGELAPAQLLLDEVMASYEARGFEIGRPYRLYDAALLSCAAGDLAAARDRVRAGIEAADDSENADIQGWMLYPAALVAAWLGDDREATDTAHRLMEYPGRAGNILGRARALSVLGIVALCRGDHDRAAAILREAVVLAADIGIGHPGALPVLSDAVVACALANDLDSANEALVTLTSQAEALDLDRTWAMLGHARGAVATAEGDYDTALELLAAGCGTFDRLGLAPDTARCEFLMGRAALRAGRRTLAAGHLDAARHRFAAMGAARWEETVAAELERASAGRSDGVLTDTERRIATLVAQGATNREVAGSLFVSVATVEAHLTRLYRKLEIRSRTELTRMVLEGAVELGESDPSDHSGAF